MIVNNKNKTEQQKRQANFANSLYYLKETKTAYFNSADIANAYFKHYGFHLSHNAKRTFFGRVLVY